MTEKPIFRKVIDLSEAKQILEQIRQDRGYRTGFTILDELTGGLVRDGVTLLAAAPYMGDATLALNIVNRVSQWQDGTILIASSSMDLDELVVRYICIGMDVSVGQLLNRGSLPENILENCKDYFYSGKSCISFEGGNGVSLDDIWQASWEIPDLRLIVVPHIENIRKCENGFIGSPYRKPQKESPEKILSTLQQLARQLKVPVLCTVSLPIKPPRRKDKRPRIGDLKKIGIEEANADQIIFLYHEFDAKSESGIGTDLIVAKAVQGTPKTVRVYHDYKTGRIWEKKKTD